LGCSWHERFYVEFISWYALKVHTPNETNRADKSNEEKQAEAKLEKIRAVPYNGPYQPIIGQV
jgi:hypothetical protein